MHTGRHYQLGEVLLWTRRETFWFVVIGTIPTLLFALADWKWLSIPWVPVALLGTAVAFVTGFKNNASYNRLWEARQVWGSLVNLSRYWGCIAHDFLQASDALRDIKPTQKRLLYRHIAFLTALRFQLREPREWETMGHSHNKEYQRKYPVAEWTTQLDNELQPFLEPEELKQVLAFRNRASYLLNRQSQEVASLYAGGNISEMQQVTLSQTISRLFDEQGRSERIKNFPYPRQFTTLNLFFIWVFIFILPLGMIAEFSKLGRDCVWLAIPSSVLISWVFHTMDKIGGVTENPFEGSANDVPITAMTRNIEIELREWLGETNLPPALKPVNHILT